MTASGDPQLTTAYALEAAPQHVYPGHPESPRRFDLLPAQLKSSGARALQTRAATREEIGRVHSAALVEWVEKACRQGEAIIDPAPTYVTRTSLDDALRAAGAALECSRAVLAGEAGNAFAIVRPPGHHAEPTRSMGFCIFNNVAVAARDALDSGLSRVAIVDYDAHHGNGTQAACLEDERMAYFSTHQWGIYPGSGWYQDAPNARGRVVNVPLPAGSGDMAFRRIGEEVLEPFIRDYDPELILVSAGFDAHWNDPITSLGLSTAGFYALSVQLVRLAAAHCGGKIVFVLEGGYDATNLRNGVAAAFAALMNTPLEDRGDAYPSPEPDVRDLIRKVGAWHGLAA